MSSPAVAVPSAVDQSTVTGSLAAAVSVTSKEMISSTPSVARASCTAIDTGAWPACASGWVVSSSSGQGLAARVSLSAMLMHTDPASPTW